MAREGWRCLAEALAARSAAPPLLADRERGSDLPATRMVWVSEPGLPEALRLAGATIGDCPQDALAAPVSGADALLWRAVALRRAGRFPEARRAFRELGNRPEYLPLFGEALALLRAPGPGFRWAGESASHLAARGVWDPIWFVDACEAVHSGLLSRETAALLEEIQRAELQLLLDAGAVG